MSTRLSRGVTTWPAIDTIQGNALLVINSPLADAQRVGEVLDTLESRTKPGGVHVIADPEWAEWLGARNVPSDRMLLAVAKTSGKPVEVNHFLVAAEALLWVVPKAFEVIAGSTPHNQYNEEIQTVFEQRVSLLLGNGVCSRTACRCPTSTSLTPRLSCTVLDARPAWAITRRTPVDWWTTCTGCGRNGASRRLRTAIATTPRWQ